MFNAFDTYQTIRQFGQFVRSTFYSYNFENFIRADVEILNRKNDINIVFLNFRKFIPDIVLVRIVSENDGSCYYVVAFPFALYNVFFNQVSDGLRSVREFVFLNIFIQCL